MWKKIKFIKVIIYLNSYQFVVRFKKKFFYIWWNKLISNYLLKTLYVKLWTFLNFNSHFFLKCTFLSGFFITLKENSVKVCVERVCINI